MKTKIKLNWFEGVGAPPQIHRKIKLSKTDRKGLEIGGKYVKGVWFRMVEVIDQVEKGKMPPKEERLGAAALVPLQLDYASLAPLMKVFLPKILLPNATLFTMITNETGEHLIWAAVEYCERGVYKWVKQLNVEEDWADEINPLIAQNDLRGAYERGKEFVREKFGVEVGWIKVARPQFFIELYKTFEAEKWGEDLVGGLPALINFLQEVFKPQPLGKSKLPCHINFYPVPYCFGMLQRLLPTLSKLKAEELSRELKRLMSRMPNSRTVAVLSDGARAAAFDVRLEDGRLLIYPIPQEEADRLFDRDVREMAEKFKDKFEPDNVLVIGPRALERLADFLEKFLQAEVPFDERAYEVLGKFVLQFLRVRDVYFDLAPEKMALATRASLGISASLLPLISPFLRSIA